MLDCFGFVCLLFDSVVITGGYCILLCGYWLYCFDVIFNVILTLIVGLNLAGCLIGLVLCSFVCFVLLGLICFGVFM